MATHLRQLQHRVTMFLFSHTGNLYFYDNCNAFSNNVILVNSFLATYTSTPIATFDILRSSTLICLATYMSTPIATYTPELWAQVNKLATYTSTPIATIKKRISSSILFLATYTSTPIATLILKMHWMSQTWQPIRLRQLQPDATISPISVFSGNLYVYANCN